MTPEKYVERAGQLSFLLERMSAISARLESLPAATNSAQFSQRHMLKRLVANVGNQLKSLTINFGHSEKGLKVLAERVLDDGQLEFVRDQAADELAYKTFYGETVTNDEIIQASGLEIEEMLPFLSTMVDRCARLLTEQL